MRGFYFAKVFEINGYKYNVMIIQYIIKKN